jgi:hypothetical protein
MTRRGIRTCGCADAVHIQALSDVHGACGRPRNQVQILDRTQRAAVDGEHGRGGDDQQDR